MDRREYPYRTIKDSPKRRQAFEDRITAMGEKVNDAIP